MTDLGNIKRSKHPDNVVSNEKLVHLYAGPGESFSALPSPGINCNHLMASYGAGTVQIVVPTVV